MTWNRDDFYFSEPDDFVRLDALCAQLLGDFFGWLQAPTGGALPAKTASDLAHAADRYLRNFVVDILETGPADPDPTLPRQYLGNWYILNTLTPSHQEVEQILHALRSLYDYLAAEGIVPPETAEQIASDLGDADHFHRRLEDFWALTTEEISGWRAGDDFRRHRSCRGSPESIEH